MKPDQQDVFFQLIVSGGGEFTYDASGNLRSSNVGQPTTDPIQGISCPQGFATFNGFGAVINLLSTSLGGFFQYFDNNSAVQGALILAVSDSAGTDPVTGVSYPAGLFGIDPAFGDNMTVVGAIIKLSQLAYSQAAEIVAQQGSGAANPYVRVSAPEQGVSGHMVMLLQGTSPDGTSPGQLLIASQPTGFTSPSPVSHSMAEIQDGAGNGALAAQCSVAAPSTAISRIIAKAAADRALAIRVTGDTSDARLMIDSNGGMSWGTGAAARDVFLSRQAANVLQILTADLDIATAGRGLQIKEGANARMGTAVLAGGTVVVNNTSITANTRIFLTAQTSGAAPGALRVSARTAGTSFTITSTSATDTSTVAWLLVEPG